VSQAFFSVRPATIYIWLAYGISVPQQAWIHSGTIRQNIAFSSADDSVDVARMDQIINACSLRPDISALPHGDL
jgi:ABC-type multidrug transport system fused ATPase/permease subunit